MGFPALLLPEVAFRHVHQFLNYTELILLAQCSKTTYNVINSIESRRKSARINITTWATEMRVELSDGDKTDKNWRRSFWRLHLTRDSITVPMKFKVFKIGSYFWIMIPRPSGFRILSDYNVDCMISWVNMLRNLFNCRLGECRYECSPFFDFNRFFISSSTLRVADKIVIRDMRFTDREMECVMDNFTTDHFHFNGSTDYGYFYDKPIRFADATLGAWYIHDFGNFMDYVGSCESLKITDPRITDENVNSVIRGWLESENTKLAEVTFIRAWKNIQGNFNLEKVFDNIATVPGTKKRKEANKRHIDDKNFEEGWDLVRKDGVLATVFCGREIITETISLIVWSDKNCYLPA